MSSSPISTSSPEHPPEKRLMTELSEEEKLQKMKAEFHTTVNELNTTIADLKARLALMEASLIAFVQERMQVRQQLIREQEARSMLYHKVHELIGSLTELYGPQTDSDDQSDDNNDGDDDDVGDAYARDTDDDDSSTEI